MTEDILEMAGRVSDEAEVYTVSSEETPVRFEANRLKSITSRQSSSVALRIIKDGRVGYSVTTSLNDLKSLVDNALDTVHFGMKAEFQFPGITPYPEVKVYDPVTETVSLEDMIKLGEEMISRVRANTPDIECAGGVSKSVSRISIRNTRGGEAEYQQTYFGLAIHGTLVRGTDMLFVGDSESSCRPIYKIDGVVSATVRQLELAKELARLGGKSLPVIFTPDGAASALIPPLMVAFNGKMVYQGASPLGGRTHEKIFDAKLCLYDDATIPYRPRSRPADDEGVPSQKTALIEEGRVRGFFYDLQTAGLTKARSTGNGERGGGGIPSPIPNAFVITPGKTSLDEMVQDIKDGILIENVMGARQGNILNGDFCGNVLLGYKIENGRVTGRVKDTMVLGNVYELLKDIAALGSDGKWVGSSFFIPSLYCHRLSVASK